MPRISQRTNRQSWSQESMNKAIEEWKENKIVWEFSYVILSLPYVSFCPYYMDKMVLWIR